MTADQFAELVILKIQVLAGCFLFLAFWVVILISDILTLSKRLSRVEKDLRELKDKVV